MFYFFFKQVLCQKFWDWILWDWFCLSYFQQKGDLLDEDQLLKWVTSEEALDIPDQIEEVNTRMLDHMLKTAPYVAVLFCKKYFQKF